MMAYLKNVASNPNLIARRNADGRSNLELPLKPTTMFAMVRKMVASGVQKKLPSVVVAVSHLPWHDLSVDATDVDACIQASLVVGINYVTPE